MSKVYICDMEVISPIGVSLEKHFENVVKGASGADTIRNFDASSFSIRIACEVTDDLSSLTLKLDDEIREISRFDRKVELFCSCTELLRPTIERKLSNIAPEKIGVFLGMGTEALSVNVLTENSVTGEEAGVNFVHETNKKCKHFNPILGASDFCSLYLATISQSRGPRKTNLSACAASAQAIGTAYRAIQSGQCDVALAGGADSPVDMFAVSAFTLLDMISKRNDSPEKASRPFDLFRDGFVVGEGAGLALLANERVVNTWKSSPIARIAGYGTSLDAYKITAPHETGYGAFLAMQRCLSDASWQTSDIDYINAHGTSTPLNDITETMAIRDLFNAEADRILVSSTKSQIGHLIAAGGIVECITTAKAIETGSIPPSINIEQQDPKCNLNVNQETHRRETITRALSNSFALAGQNATLALEKAL